MLFLTRSALCIGIVAVAASHVGVGGVATAVDRGARQAAAGAGRACLRSEACLRVGAAALASSMPLRALAEEPSAPPVSPARPPRRPDPRPGHTAARDGA